MRLGVQSDVRARIELSEEPLLAILRNDLSHVATTTAKAPNDSTFAGLNLYQSSHAW